MEPARDDEGFASKRLASLARVAGDSHVMPHLALVLPGGGYGPAGSALRFPALALAQCGAEVCEVRYRTAPPREFDLEAGRDFYFAARDQLQAIVDEHQYTKVTFIAKSLGTMVLGAIGRELTLPAVVAAVWITPIFSLDYVRNGALARGWRSLIVSGAADRYYDPRATDQVVSSLGADSVVLDGADHSLEVSGDVLATIEGMQRLASAVVDFASG